MAGVLDIRKDAEVNSRFDAVVIGAGANGLVAAAALAKGGLHVLLLEEHEAIGGQGRLLEFAPGFRAPALGSEAGWIPPTVARGLGIEVERTEGETALSVPLDDGEFLTISSNVAKVAHMIHRYSANDAVQLHDFVDRLHKFAGFLAALYQAPPPDIDTTSRSERFDLFRLGSKLRSFGRQDMTEFLRVMPMSIEELAEDSFETTALKAAIVTGGVRHLRQGPRSGGTTFALMHGLVPAARGSFRNSGWWREGPDAFVAAAATSARSLGATIRRGAKVAQIMVRDDAVVGVRLQNGSEISAPCVLSTADPAQTLLGLVEPLWLDPEFLHAVANIKYRGCTAVVLYALDELPEIPGVAPESLDGIVSLTRTIADLERAADAAKYGEISERPHIELTVPTLRWPQAKLAPAGKHVLVATAQYAPYKLRDTAPWDARLREVLADRVTASIDAVAPCFSARVLHRSALSPRDIEGHYGLTEGAITQGELMLDQILFMRPVPGHGRYAMPVRGLYLGGSGAHPGPGILGGAGWLAAARVLEDFKRKVIKAKS
jgi:phytoene dehydrogenase-like protein